MKNSEKTKKAHKEEAVEAKTATKHSAAKSHGCGCGYCGATAYEEEDFIIEDDQY